MSFGNFSDECLDELIKNVELTVKTIRNKITDFGESERKARKALGAETMTLRALQSEKNNRKKYGHKEGSQ